MVSSRLDFLKRENAGRARRAEWEAKLTEIVGMPRGSWRFVDLETTDQIRHKAEHAFSPRYVLAHAMASHDFMEVQIEPGLAAQVENPLVPSSTGELSVLFFDSSTVGAISLPARVLNQHWKALLRAETDGFSVVGDAPLGKLVVQVVSKSDAYREMIDIAIWGEEWVSTARQFAEATTGSLGS